MSSPSIVRRAIPQDSNELWRLFRLLHAENAMCPISKGKVDYHLARFLNPSAISKDDCGSRGFIGVIGQTGSLEGAIMLMITQQWYSEECMVEEAFNFVDPNHRSSNHSKALISYAKYIVDENLPTTPTLKLVIGILSLKRTAAKIRLYGQVLKPAGAFFVHPAMAGATGEPLKRLYKGHGNV